MDVYNSIQRPNGTGDNSSKLSYGFYGTLFNLYGVIASGQSINSKRQKKKKKGNFIFATAGTACSILRMSRGTETDASCPVLRRV